MKFILVISILFYSSISLSQQARNVVENPLKSCLVSKLTIKEGNDIYESEYDEKRINVDTAVLLMSDDCLRSKFIKANFDLDDVLIFSEDLSTLVIKEGLSFKEALKKIIANYEI